MNALTTPPPFTTGVRCARVSAMLRNYEIASVYQELAAFRGTFEIERAQKCVVSEHFSHSLLRFQTWTDHGFGIIVNFYNSIINKVPSVKFYDNIFRVVCAREISQFLYSPFCTPIYERLSFFAVYHSLKWAKYEKWFRITWKENRIVYLWFDIVDEIMLVVVLSIYLH